MKVRWFTKGGLFWGSLMPEKDYGQGTVIVTVLEPNGRSAPGASVSMNGVYKGSTDNRGVLTIQNVSPGDYKISADKKSSPSSLRGSTQVWVRRGQTIPTSIQLSQGR